MEYIEILKDIIFFIITLVFGAQNVLQRKTIKSLKIEAVANAEKATAEAQKVWKEVETREIENVDAVSKMWREMAETMSEKYDNIDKQAETLNTELKRLTGVLSKIVQLLNKITPENLEETVTFIKQEIENEFTKVSTGSNSFVLGMQNAPPNCRSPN